jgi:hypothetical protein
MKWVRPLISLIMAGEIAWGFNTGKIDPKDFLLIAAGAIGWWYVSRDKEKKGEPFSPHKEKISFV